MLNQKKLDIFSVLCHLNASDAERACSREFFRINEARVKQKGTTIYMIFVLNV